MQLKIKSRQSYNKKNSKNYIDKVKKDAKIKLMLTLLKKLNFQKNTKTLAR